MTEESLDYLTESDILSDTTVRGSQIVFNATSFSRLSVFEQCKFRAKLQYIDKIPEPPRPLPPGMTEHYNDRGSRIHSAGQLYVEDNVELQPELASFRAEYEALRAMFRAGKAIVEQDWAVDRDWMTVEWMSSDVFMRIKLDAFVNPEPSVGLVIDLKTGKKKGNEVKHADQGQLYVLAAFLRYPDLQSCTVEFWYSDQNDITSVHYTRAQAMRLYKGWNKRALKMVNEDDFEPNPSITTCKYCPYGPDGTGHCKVGVSKNQAFAKSKFQARAPNWWD